MTEIIKDLAAGLFLIFIICSMVITEGYISKSLNKIEAIFISVSVMAVIVVVVLLMMLGFARAFDKGQWDGFDPKIVQWYRALMQPDNPAVSCCGEADSYWADSFEVQGNQYVAIITDSRPDDIFKRRHVDVGTKIVVPNHKIKWDQSNPTGHGVIFLSRNDYVFCYVPPGGV
jgi:hypothetical protein